MPNLINCSFCGKPRNEVKGVVSAKEEGPHICDRCIDAAANSFKAGLKKGGFEKVKEEEPLKKPHEIRAHLDQYVIGQSQAKVDLSIAVYNHFKRRKLFGKVDPGSDPIEIEKSNIVMLGPSGTGKTFLAKTIAKLLKVPFHVGDATRLTQAGYVGDDVETLLQGLILDAGGDIERAQWGIIFLDEVDKIARGGGRERTGYRDVSGEGVQQALLKLLEGSKVSVPRATRAAGMAMAVSDTIDTSNILFICAGSFAGIEGIVDQRINKDSRQLGFGAKNTKTKLDATGTYQTVTEDDLMAFGIIPEMMGRLPVITTTIELTEDEMVQILTEAKNSIIKQVKALFAIDDVCLDFTEGALRAIAKEAKKRPTGARALRSIVEKVLKPFSYDAPSTEDLKEILITEENVLVPAITQPEVSPTYESLPSFMSKCRTP